MTEKLKPCPFCGSSSVTVGELYPSSYARCLACGAESRLCYSRDEAAAVWNRRTEAAKELVVRFNVSDEQVRRMVDEAVSAAIDRCMEQIGKAAGL